MQATAKRTFDVIVSATGAILLAPMIIVIALAVKAADGGPVLFKQERIGRNGVPFRIWKFRTMVTDAPRRGLAVTAAADRRVTRVGRFLRRYKLDELPQLANVLCGDMSLVGPRPEVPRYVARYDEAQRAVLTVRPGITDPASLQYRNEEHLLASAADVERFYVEEVMPLKLALNLGYIRDASLWLDVRIILRTILAMLWR
jgi:lipopolysaccharide/colanic/teichoic acid biosynthesis glycosyltransferase